MRLTEGFCDKQYHIPLAGLKDQHFKLLEYPEKCLSGVNTLDVHLKTLQERDHSLTSVSSEQTPNKIPKTLE